MDDTEFLTAVKVIEASKPLGDWVSKPAVPATNVPVTNTAGHTMLVEINVNGATGFSVKIDGVTVGARTTGGDYFVRNGSTIALVYTGGPPTWQWFHV